MDAMLEVYSAPLAGRNLVEASAGTGKTWSLCGLYLRLLLEKNLTVGQILVVTFTNAATAELRTRMRARLLAALAGLKQLESGVQPASDEDPALTAYLARQIEAQGARTLVQRLVLARESFDEAAIFTLHGFCQRALADTPFTSGLPFELEALEEDAELRLLEARDFWRRRILTLDVPCLGHLLEGGESPARYADALGRILAKPLAEPLWEKVPQEFAWPDPATLAARFARLSEAWSAGANDPAQVLQGSLGLFKANMYTAEGIARGAQEWQSWLATGDPLHRGADDKGSKLSLYGAKKIASGTRKAHEGKVPVHPFFTASEEFLQAQRDYSLGLEMGRALLLQEFLTEAPAALRARKRQLRVVAFNDMLANLHSALVSEGGRELTAALRARFPVALIDEFQDTDPLQFEILRRIYGDEAHSRQSPLFLVGDPKQAIYSFRNADLQTYLQASAFVTGRYRLGVNRRSTPRLVAACNALFGQHPRAFLQTGIDFSPVQWAAQNPPPLQDTSTAPRAALEVWWLPRSGEGGWLPCPEARKLCAQRTAEEIARLIGERQRILLGQRSLRAADIAVLVRTHAEGRLVRQALQVRGVACVEMSPASVFHTLEAEELERVLLALARRSDALLRAAATSSFLGGTSGRLIALTADHTAFLALVERFNDYRAAWQARGFAAMFRRFLHGEQVSQRILAQAGGERRLTNLLHLGELLGAAASTHPGPDALLRWFRGQRQASGMASEAAQLRLESDANLVRIVTIHKAKGLEYPVVFCPFLWVNRAERQTSPPREYHQDGKAVLDYRCTVSGAEENQIKATRQREADAEYLRLVYVAVTRASHRCYLFAGLYRHGNEKDGKSAVRSQLNWLVAGAGVPPEQWADRKLNPRTPEEIEQAWRGLSGSGGRVTGTLPADGLAGLQVEDLPVIAMPAAAVTGTETLGPRRGLPAPVREEWTRSSFTGLTRQLRGEARTVDHDTAALPPPLAAEPPPALPPEDILLFPRGANAGNCLHRVFEELAFDRPETWDAAIGRALHEYPQGGPPAGAELQADRLRQMLKDVLECPLPSAPSLRLRDLAAGDRLHELPFTLTAPVLATDRLLEILNQADYPQERLPSRVMTGFLSGAIDLVFRHAGKYYLLDWKSNFLGYRREDYARPALAQEMRRHSYHLQHMIYTVALTRYLRMRQPGYDYARHFGGVFYLFVRAVRPHWALPDGTQAGVYFTRAAPALVAAAERCLGDARTEPA